MNLRAFLFGEPAKLQAGERNTTSPCLRRVPDAESGPEAVLRGVGHLTPLAPTSRPWYLPWEAPPSRGTGQPKLLGPQGKGHSLLQLLETLWAGNSTRGVWPWNHMFLG